MKNRKVSFQDKVKRRIDLIIKLYQLKRRAKKAQFKPDHSFLIFSDPRGGSTWVAELIATIPDSFIYWEPLNPAYMKDLKDMGFGWRQHIPKNENWPEAKDFFNQILSASIINEWTALKVSTDQYKNGRFPIIKICRGNHLLPWLVKQFDFKFKPIYMVRHPMAIVSSQIKQGGWDSEYSKFSMPTMPFNEVYLRHKEFLSGLKTKGESLLATWCITNRNLLKHKNNSWITVFYEELMLDPETHFNNIFSEWELPVPSKLFNRFNLWSSTSLNTSQSINRKNQLIKWKNEFSEDELKRFQIILDYFDISTYTAYDPMPKHKII